MDAKRVAVIMSAYNGEKHIRAQIQSILRQRGVAVKLFIRDDGSRDSTVRIIEEYSAAGEDVVFVNPGEVRNLGVKESFLTALRFAMERCPEIHYFCFADQDDVWKEDKIAEALSCFSERERNILYFSNKTIVDSSLNFIRDEHIAYYGDILEICWGAQASGCTMLFDAALAKIALSHSDEIELLHDSLFFRVAHIVGAKIIFDERSFILYRQHAANVIGIEGAAKTNYNWKGLLSRPEHFISNLCRQLLTLYGDFAAPGNRKYLEWIANYRHSFRARANLILNDLARRRPFKLYMIWVGKILLRRL